MTSHDGKAYAKAFNINSACMECITALYNDSKTICKQPEASEIHLTPLTKAHTTCSDSMPSSKPDRDAWVKHGGNQLTKKEKQEILNNIELSDMHINAF